MARATGPKFLKRLGGGVAENGTYAVVTLERNDGEKFEFDLEPGYTLDLATKIETLGAKCIEEQRASLKGFDPRVFYPFPVRRIAKLGPGMDEQGRPLLSVTLDTGSRIDLALDPEQSRALFEWLGRFQDGNHLPQTKPS